MADSSPFTEIIAISSVVIALCALGISIWQGYIARKHNKLSVVPILHIDVDTTEGKDIEIASVNNGVGPAIITHFTIYCDNVAYDFPDMAKYREIVPKLGLDPAKNWCDAEIPVKGNALKPGDRFLIMKFRGTGASEQLHRHVGGALPRLRFVISYESIYRGTRVLDHKAA